MNSISRRILLVDDDVNLVEGIQRKLRHQYEIATAASGPAGLELLRQTDPFAVIVADYKMPEMDGVTFLREVRRISPDSVSVMLTAWGDLNVAISALHEGKIYRFLNKPCPDELLEATLNDCLEQHRLISHERQLTGHLNQAISELAERNKELERLSQQLTDMNLELSRLSRVDLMTGLLNWQAWTEAASMEQERAQRQKQMLGIIMIDVDFFKGYNDHLGHQAGDECLRAVGQCIQSVCRSIDVAGRYGGEEFTIVSISQDAAGVRGLAERLRQAVWNLDIPHPSSPAAPRVTVSVGWAASSFASWEELTKEADEAMYAAKKAGRNRVCHPSDLPASEQTTVLQ